MTDEFVAKAELETGAFKGDPTALLGADGECTEYDCYYLQNDTNNNSNYYGTCRCARLGA